MSKKILCEDCGEQIPLARLRIVPDTTMCVDCLQASGDIFKYRAFPTNVTSKTLGGVEEICKTKEQFERLKEQNLDIDYSILHRKGSGE